MKRRIPFNRPCFQGNELLYISDAIERRHVSGDGYYTKACQQLLAKDSDVSGALLTTSCTHALEMSAILLDIQPGDEVIVPSFTFVSTVNAFVLRGAVPVFCDIRADTLNLDETLVPKLVTARTKAIVAVHYAGVACEMDTLLRQAEEGGFAVVEDNAHGLYGSYKNRPLGSFGGLSTLSFHETKNFTCGEGGALLIRDPEYMERAEIIREKGTNRSRFFRGQVDKYTWVDIGSSYLPSDILAAFLFAQLEVRERIQAHRKRIWTNYAENLEDWAASAGFRLPVVPAHCDQPYHMFYLLARDVADRTAFIEHMAGLGIQTVFHYLPLHASDMGARFGAKPGDCPVTLDLSDRLVRLPFFTDLTEAEQREVVKGVRKFRS